MLLLNKKYNNVLRSFSINTMISIVRVTELHQLPRFIKDYRYNAYIETNFFLGLDNILKKLV